MGLLLSAVVALFLVIWLAIGQTQAGGLRQNSPVSPPDQPTATEIPTQTQAETPTETPTDTPIPQAQETPAEVPTEAPTETPTEFPTETPTDTPTPLPPPTVTPTSTPTVRPFVVPTPTPDPTLFGLAGLVVDAALTSAAWIWFTCGSLLFFVVAGAIAGLSFYRQGQRRFELYEIVPEEAAETPAQKGKGRDRSLPSDEETWPSSLP